MRKAAAVARPRRSRTLPAMKVATCVAAALLAAAVPAQKDEPTIAGKDGARCDEIVRAFDAAAGGFSGSVLVAKDGAIVLEQGYGLFDAAKQTPMPVDALWDWASVSKQFTAAALLKLQDQKKLKLDDALHEHWKKAPDEKRKVTVRMLLNHTSGIEAGFKNDWRYDRTSRQSLVDLVLGLPMTGEPGQAFDYSNSGYALAAALVEEVTGKSFEKYCVEELFRPAGMKTAGLIGWPKLDLDRVPQIDRGKGFTDRPAELHFAYGDELTWGYRGCGGVVASTADMLAWDRALRGKKLLSKRALEQLYQPAKDGYALGWEVGNGPFGREAQHGGSVLGVTTHYLRLLDRDVVVAIAANYDVKTNPARLARDLAAVVAR